MFFVGAVDDRRTANFGNLPTVSIVRPTADLLAADHILDEHNTAVETQRQLVKQLDVLEQVVVRVTTHTHNQTMLICHFIVSPVTVDFK